MSNNKLENLQNNIISRITAKEKPLDIIDNLIDDMCIYKFNGKQYDIRTNFDISIIKEDAKLLYELLA